MTGQEKKEKTRKNRQDKTGLENFEMTQKR